MMSVGPPLAEEPGAPVEVIPSSQYGQEIRGGSEGRIGSIQKISSGRPHRRGPLRNIGGEIEPKVDPEAQDV